MACVQARGCIFSKDDWKRLPLLLATPSSQIASPVCVPSRGVLSTRKRARLSRCALVSRSSSSFAVPRGRADFFLRRCFLPTVCEHWCVRACVCVCVCVRARLCVYTTELASFLSTHRAGSAGDVTLQAAAGDRRQQQPPPPRRRDWLALLIISMLAKREGPVTPPNPAAEAAATSDAQGVSPAKEPKPQGRGAGPTRAELEGTARARASRSPRGPAGARPQRTLETCWGDPGPALSSAFTDPPPAPRDYLSPERNPSMRRR